MHGVPPSGGSGSEPSILNSQLSTPNQVLSSPTPAAPTDLRRHRREELRAEEWSMHRELMNAADAMLKTFYDNPHKTTVNDLARVIDLASQLGRRATELESDTDVAGVRSETLIFEFRAALKRVYSCRQAEGKSLPDGVVLEAEVVPTPAASPEVPATA
jgi:hypothetical protein